MKLATAALAVLLPCAAVAQGMTCKPQAEMAAWLADDYHEHLVGRGLNESGTAMSEVYAGSEGGTWTIVATDRTGRSCIVAAGVGWMPEPAPIPGSMS